MVKSLKEVFLPGLLILASPFIYTERVLDPVMVPGILFYATVLLPFSVIVIFGLIKRKLNAGLLNSNLVKFYLGFLIFSAISIILAINPGEGIWEFLRTALFFIIFISIALSMQNEEKLHLSLPIIFALFSISILYYGIRQLIGVLAAGPLDHQASYLINSVLAHRNLFSDALFFTLPFLMMGVYFHKGLLRFVFILLIAITLSIITLIMVRSVWLAVIASSVMAFVVLLIFRKSFGISTINFRKLVLWAFAGLVVVMISLAVYSRFGSLEVYKKQTHVLKNYQYGSAIERVQLWQKTWEMFKESPFIGVGKGNWRILLPNYGASGMRSAQGEIVYQRPHNDFLWVLSESGIFAFAFYLLIFLTAFYYIILIIRNSSALRDKYFALFLLFFLIGYAIIASFSFPMERPVHSLFLSLVLAITLVKYQKIRKTKFYKPANLPAYLFAIFTITTLCLTILVGYYRFKGEEHTRRLMHERINSRWHRVIEEAEKAESFFMKLDPTATPMKWYSGLAWYNLGEMKMARIDFEEACKVHPYHLHVLNNLATIIGKEGDSEKAKMLYQESVRISPEFKDASLNLSVIYYNTGQLDSAYLILRNVTGADNHPNYRNVVTAIVYDKVEALKTKVDDRDLLVTLTRIRNSHDWMVKVHEQAVYDKIPLEKHLIVESIYMLETVDATIDQSRAAHLRMKYLNGD